MNGVAGRGLQVDRISKSYGATVALEDVCIHLERGQVHGLLGENGAGKSTLVKILSGVVAPDSGRMLLDERPYRPKTILQARAEGVATAFQELSLAANLTVGEAVLMPRLRKGSYGLISTRRTTDAAQAILEKFDLGAVDAGTFVSDLTLADRQRVEIVRALSQATEILVLDEPTAALPEVEWLFTQVRQATLRGTAVLYISHRLSEIRSLCPVATVLRNGRSIETVSLAEASDDRIFELMVGHSKEAVSRDRRPAQSGAPLLDVRSLATARLADVSLQVGAGEILGVAALDGQGQKSLFYALAGLEARTTGEVRIGGKAVHPTSPRAALADGIGLLPEERKVEGILTSLSTAGNIVLPIIGQLGRNGFIWSKLEQAAASSAGDAVGMSPRYMGFRIGDLSGGNQQKALLARVLASGASTLLLFDPTRGVDVGTKEAIYTAIRAFADRGAVLVYSSELQELVKLADRCIVLYGGRVFAEFEADAIEERSLVAALTGHRAEMVQ